MKRRSKWDQLQSDLRFSGQEIMEGPHGGTFAPLDDKFDLNSAAPTQSGSDAAAARAARLNAMLAAQGKIMKAPAPLLLANAIPQQTAPQLFALEVVINDIPSRVMLTRSATHQEILRQTGAAVSVKGRYMTPVEKSTVMMDRPLYLYVCADSQPKVDAAGEKIKKIILQSELSFPIDQRPFTNNQHLFYTIGFGATQPQQRTEQGQVNAPGLRYVQDKVFAGIDSIPGFDVVEKISGPQGSYLRHIAIETGAKVFLRGRGSGCIEPTSGKESFEPLHLYISHPRNEGLHAAKRLCDSLVQKVRNDYDMFVQSLYQPQRQFLLDGPSEGISELCYRPGPPSLMSLQLPDPRMVQLPEPQMHHFPPARHPLPAAPPDFHHSRPPHPPLMEPPYQFDAEPPQHPPYNPRAGPPMQLGPPPHAPYDIQPSGPPPPCPPAPTFDYPPPQPDYQAYNTQPSPQPSPQPPMPLAVPQSAPLGFNVGWNPAAVVATNKPLKDGTDAPPPAKRRFTERVVSETSESNSVKPPSQNSDSSARGKVEFRVPDIIPPHDSPRRSQPSYSGSAVSFMPPPPARGSGPFAKPAPPVWQDKAEKQTKDDSPGKGRRVSGLASLMAYEGDSDDDEST